MRFFLSCKRGLIEAKVWREKCISNFHDKGLVCSKSHVSGLTLLNEWSISKGLRKNNLEFWLSIYGAMV